MIKLLITTIVFFTLHANADAVEAEDTIAPAVNFENNKYDVRPTYKNIDNSVEKSKEFSWGTVYYSSVTVDDESDHTQSSKDQTQLNIRYVCKNAKSQNLNLKRFSFCGYAKSEEDMKQRQHLVSELKKDSAHKGKSDAALQAIYDQEYNNRIVDPIWNILDKSVDGKTSIEITVRQNAARFGSCEEKVTNISIPVACK